jgi:hypothetical protein
MVKQIFFVFFLCGLVALSGCKKRDNAPPPPKTQAQGTSVPNEQGPLKYDACVLITNQEIETIEGSPVKDIKPSGRSDKGLLFSQCFYTTAEFKRSVSLAVTKRDPDTPAARSAKQYWEEIFAKYRDENKEREAEADKEKRESLSTQRRERGEEEGVPPKKISGVGDEAFWLGNRVGGALYVLKNDAFIRVSVGGPDPESGKIEKCKALAQKALPRL